MNSPSTPDSPNEPAARGFSEPPLASLAPEALAGLGKLRECVAAAKNLQHLVSSRDVGPKMLSQMVPDVVSELEPFSRTVAEVYEFVQGRLNLPRNSLSALVESAHSTSSQLIECLRIEARSNFNAKRRLTIERHLRTSLPPLASTLSQIELLVDATSSTGVTMSVAEFLSSTPDTGSNRPFRRIHVLGEMHEQQVAIPARIGLRCLGMIASGLEDAGRPCSVLRVSTQGDCHLLRFVAESPFENAQVEIPVYPHTDYSLATVAAALGGFSGALLDDHSGISLPRA